MDFGSILSIGGALFGGLLTKKAGKKAEIPYHKLGSPVAAAAAAMAIEAGQALIAGGPVDVGAVVTAGGEYGAAAVLGFTLAKNAVELGKFILKRKETK